MLFKSLTETEVERIVDLLFDEVRSRLAERRIVLDVDDAARRLIAREGFDPVYGARPLKRFIAHEVETRIGRALLGGDALEGAVVSITADDGELRVSFENSAGVPASNAA